MISVSTEISEVNRQPALGWVLFDGDCEFCRAWVTRLQPILGPRGFAFVPLQTPWVRAHFHLPEDQLLIEMRVLFSSGEAYGGADAVVELAIYVWWAWPLVVVAHIPGVPWLLRALYRYIAAQRSCLSGTCSTNASSAALLSPTDHKGASL